MKSTAQKVVEKCSLVDGAFSRETVMNMNDGVCNYVHPLSVRGTSDGVP